MNQLHKIHDFLQDNNIVGLSFVDAVLDHLNISYRVDNKQIQNIPALGKVIIVANHPLGTLDALTLIKMVRYGGTERSRLWQTTCFQSSHN